MSDQFTELATPQQFELPKVFEGMRDYIKPVSTRPAKVSKDEESAPYILKARLPIIGGDVDASETTNLLARVITQDSNGDSKAKYLSFKTTSAHRADYLWPVIFKLKDSATVMSNIMTKGSGDIQALEKAGTPYTSGYPGGEIAGAVSIGDIRMDAKNSKRLHDAGLRTRVAIGIFRLDEIPCDGKIKTPQNLLDDRIVKKKENLPGIGIFASRGVYRVEDVFKLLNNEKINSSAITALITYIIRVSEVDDSPEFKKLYEKYNRLLLAGNISIDNRRQIIKDFSLSFASVMGKQAAKLEKIKAVRRKYDQYGEDRGRDETVNNISCMAELMDNSDMNFDATPEEIAKYQKLYFENGTLFIGGSVEKITEDTSIYQSMERQFIDAYLNEIAPRWSESTIPEDFMIYIKSALHFEDVDDLRRAYWICKSKVKDSMTSGKIIEEPTMAGNLTYHFLKHCLRGTDNPMVFFLNKFIEYDSNQKRIE